MKQKVTCLVGLQYGDEGKGSISQYLAGSYDVFVRYQGGGNAGHTIYKDGHKIVTHFLPVGIIEEGGTVILGNGMVINPSGLINEIKEVADALGETFISVSERVFISNKAHVITKELVKKDAKREKTQKIGTTKTGVGPAYESKFNRTGITVDDILSSPDYEEFQRKLGSQVVSTEIMLNQAYVDGKNIFFEGAQGTMLDIDFGQYPFVTSSNCLPSAIGHGAGFSPRKITNNIGVIKPYSTRVGAGPFPTEMRAEEDELFRSKGVEFGATTGRPRKCGWLDIPSLRYAIQIADIDELAISKLDIIEGIGTIPVCVGYKIDDFELDGVSDFPSKLEWSKVKPIYENWPINRFVELLQDHAGIPVKITSYGPNIEDKIFMDKYSTQTIEILRSMRKFGKAMQESLIKPKQTTSKGTG